MRKVTNGRTYNTETSKRIGTWDNGHYTNDFNYCSEDLYKNTKGAYFLHGEGGPLSKYATRSGDNSGWGEEIIPMTAEEAQEWAEAHLDGEEVEAAFGIQEEASPSDLTTRERVNLTIDTELMSRFREHSAKTGIPMSRLVDKAIEWVLNQ
jgi:predicted DNA binding CopG/RHH family protein